ncbi:class I SAM-dependent methyltransferase [Paraferrimonas haliotis]|uniref:25S rRNA (uridine-N(3))-methyltransferase BMT5-like domain-containing protein n=1 Tax=Paraferrimonas haliotis TaxID=2013866 RepID=A0AA37TU68_9GAMM|nr:class I SAM-dependent methyltransferase [Paraferrimonas haliotis]GLS84271.1 hypothetical protein GCM10007894_22480 [Paraferrimonas haliotis]
MFLEPHWRVLTIGDGDLSFSYCLAQQQSVATVVASSLDSESEVIAKYRHQYTQYFKENKQEYYPGLDINKPEQFPKTLQGRFDAVIFQFPLITAQASRRKLTSHQYSSNLLNRQLLHHFLRHSKQYFLDPNGPMVAIITSKDVKPYCHWNIEGSLNHGLSMPYLGWLNFDLDAFPNYRIRNVDRDKFVKKTLAKSYYFAAKPSPLLAKQVTANRYAGARFCSLCRCGPMLTQQEWAQHQESKRHQQMLTFEKDWLAWLNER